MSGKQHQLLAVLAGLQGAAVKIANETQRTFAEKHGLFLGLNKTYKPSEEEGDKMPSEGNPEVSTTVGEKLDHLANIFSPYIDGLFQVEATNQIAKANIDIDGLFLAGIPATFLIQFDKKLSILRDVLNAIPTLDPKRTWSEDEDAGAGIHRGSSDVTYRNKKVLKTLIKYEATEKHPAQTEVYNEEVRVGQYTTDHWSGMLTPRKKFEIMARLDILQRAVKQALSQANDTEHVTSQVAGGVFKYLFGDIPLSRA